MRVDFVQNIAMRFCFLVTLAGLPLLSAASLPIAPAKTNVATVTRTDSKTGRVVRSVVIAPRLANASNPVVTIAAKKKNSANIFLLLLGTRIDLCAECFSEQFMGASFLREIMARISILWILEQNIWGYLEWLGIFVCANIFLADQKHRKCLIWWKCLIC